MLRTLVLNERKATGFYYDTVTDMARVLVIAPPATVRTRTLAGDLLLDREGFLVGIDVEPRAPARVVVMLGPHEKVATKVPARLGVACDASGSVCEVRIQEARVTIRGAEKNPYL